MLNNTHSNDWSDSHVSFKCVYLIILIDLEFWIKWVWYGWTDVEVRVWESQYIPIFILYQLGRVLCCHFLFTVTKIQRDPNWKKPDVPKRGDKPIHGLVSDKNFIVANAVENILAGKFYHFQLQFFVHCADYVKIWIQLQNWLQTRRKTTSKRKPMVRYQNMSPRSRERSRTSTTLSVRCK